MIETRATPSYTSTETDYSKFYVVATDPAEAYKKVRLYLNDRDLCFTHERELKSVILIAKEKDEPECKTMLFL